MELRIARNYRLLAGILAALLLTLPASAANWNTTLAPMPSGRTQPAVETINGIVYVAGGYTSGNANTSTLQAFNPETNTWTNLANLPLGLGNGDGAGVINSQLYIAGGWNGTLPTDSLLMYDPPSNTWTNLAAMPQLSGGGATGVINSQLYVTTPENG